jgi:DNA-binding response OmpR family regulator
MQQPYIFVVDDHPDAAALLVDLLSLAKYESKTFFSGFEVLKGLQNPARLPDLILLDLMMPGMDGLEVVRRIKTNPDLPFIPIIILTASGESQDRINGLQTGADDFLFKPINRAELMARVRSLLRLKRAYDEQTRLLEEIKSAYDRLNEAHINLAVAEKKKGQMEAMMSTAAAICHEMSQPLTSALITLQLLKQTAPQEVSDNEDYDAVEMSLLQARQILDKLRALTRYETKSYLGDEHILDLDLSSRQETGLEDNVAALREGESELRLNENGEELIG